MSAQIQAVITELIEERRGVQARIKAIDEALLALQAVGGLDGPRRLTAPRSAETRAKNAEAMRRRWAEAKALGQKLNERRESEPVAV